MRLSDAQLFDMMAKQGLQPTGPRPKERKPRDNTESRAQAALVSWWEHAHKGLGVPLECLFSVPNGGWRGVVTASILKREGLRRGTCDMLLMVKRGPYGALCLEMKAPDGVTSPEQRRFLQTMTEQGYLARVSYSVASAMNEITEYLLIK